MWTLCLGAPLIALTPIAFTSKREKRLEAFLFNMQQVMRSAAAPAGSVREVRKVCLHKICRENENVLLSFMERTYLLWDQGDTDHVFYSY